MMSARKVGRLCAAFVLGGCGLLLPAAPGHAQEREPVSLESLLSDMVDRDRLARLPNPAYVCRQFSSYDRDTVAPGKPGWFANWDRSQFIRVEENAGRREYVLMDAEGPGAVVRFWGTWHGPRKDGRLKPFTNGTLRIYLDHQAQPVIADPIADLISGGKLVGPPFSESVSPKTPYARRGHNLYLPIPYQTHCKITYESDGIVDFGARQGEALYYQINYRTYESGTRVTSFSRDQLKELEPLLAHVGERLVRSGVALSDRVQDHALGGLVAPGKEKSLTLEGPAAIRQLTMRLEADDLAQALRSVVLEVECDDQRTVWCPVGDFFGIGYEVRPYRTWYTEVAEDGTMRAFWVMPFERTCRWTIRNLGDRPVELTATALAGPWEWDDRSLYFHATWRQYTKVDTGPNKDMTGNGAVDVNYVEVTGRGQYVGDTLTVFNGASAWWGEGDEKIYIDGETFPSHIGTGTEDYYGYAWCRPEFFATPFHAQPCGDGNLAGGLSVNSRYRILDALPFSRSIKFDMELWHWRATRMNYAPATFWYARPGAKSNVEPEPKRAAEPVARKRSDVVETLRVPGAIEGESLKILEKTGGITMIQDIDLFGWSGDCQLWWRDAAPGDRLPLELPVREPGAYHITANLTKANDYGIVRIRINDRAAPRLFDRYAPRVSHDRLDLGVFPLKKGSNRLVIEIVGANDRAVKRHMFGLDYLLLRKAAAQRKRP